MSGGIRWRSQFREPTGSYLFIAPNAQEGPVIMTDPSATANRTVARPSVPELSRLHGKPAEAAAVGYCWWCGRWSQVNNAICSECRAKRARKR
jgi:hypothetical protein